jgi:hypothetical protein
MGLKRTNAEGMTDIQNNHHANKSGWKRAGVTKEGVFLV